MGENIQDDNYRSAIAALSDGRDDSQIKVIEEAKRLGIRSHIFKCYGRFDLSAVFRLKKYLIQNKIDILHTHNYKSDIIGALAAKMAGIPVVATAHGFTDVTRSVSFYERLDRWFLKHFFKKVVTVTDKILSDLLSEKRSVIPNGVDIEKFKRNEEKGKVLRNEYNIGEADILIGTVGRLSKEKNQKMLLEALYSLMRDDERVKVMLVGAGLKEWELKQFAEARHLTDRIIFTGIMKDTVAAYSAMDIFVLSSLTEGVPLTVLEAMSCRVPVVATRVGGIPEMLKDGEAGLLVGAQDVDGLRRKIEQLIKDADKRHQLSDFAHAFVKNNYSIRQMCYTYREAYNGVLN